LETLILQKLCPELSGEELIRIARESGFSKRVGKKNLTGRIFVVHVSRINQRNR
jgi:hypothetical protein